MARRSNLLPLSVLFALTAIGLTACGGPADSEPDQKAGLVIPRGYVSRLEVVHEGRRYRFGPFVGYYFRPEDPGSLEYLDFVVFNQNSFYTLDLPADAQLFDGRAVFTTLPDVGRSLPGAEAKERINPVFSNQIPEPWLKTRPAPAGEYPHFHSCYDARGAVRHGYWLRHVAKADFTYDMGGRVGAESPLYHQVKAGVDRDFARIVEFDRGPR